MLDYKKSPRLSCFFWRQCSTGELTVVESPRVGFNSKLFKPLTGKEDFTQRLQFPSRELVGTCLMICSRGAAHHVRVGLFFFLVCFFCFSSPDWGSFPIEGNFTFPCLCIRQSGASCLQWEPVFLSVVWEAIYVLPPTPYWMGREEGTG